MELDLDDPDILAAFRIGASAAPGWDGAGYVPSTVADGVAAAAPISVDKTVQVPAERDFGDWFGAAIIAFICGAGAGFVTYLVLSAYFFLQGSSNVGYDVDHSSSLMMLTSWVTIGIAFYKNSRPEMVSRPNPEYDRELEPYIWAARQGALLTCEVIEEEKEEERLAELADLRRTWRLTGEEQWLPNSAPCEPGHIGSGLYAPARAEEAAAIWMRWLGADDTRVTQETRDGGIDVFSARWVGQVKWQVSPVPPSKVREIVGVSYQFGKEAVFFASPAGYSTEATRFADTMGVALFVMDDATGRLEGANTRADDLLIHGAGAAPQVEEI